MNFEVVADLGNIDDGGVLYVIDHFRYCGGGGDSGVYWLHVLGAGASDGGDGLKMGMIKKNSRWKQWCDGRWSNLC